MILLPTVGGRYEEERQDKSFEGSPQEKECQEFIEKVEGREKVPHLTLLLRTYFLAD